MRKIALFAATLAASCLVFSTGALADDMKSGEVPQVSSEAGQGRGNVGQSKQVGAVKQEKERQRGPDISSPYGEEYWKENPQLHLWEEQDFVQSWYSDC